jgi:putative heme-binding domain-containing protein
MLELLGQQPDAELGRDIVAALEMSTAIGSVPATDLRNWFGKFPQPIPQQIEQASNKRRANLSERIQLIEELVPLVESGDIRRGQQIFHSSKTACYACHEMGYLGGDIGPDLTRIGRTRSPRDLLEAIVVPSASFVRSYEPWTVATTDGRIVSGVLRENSQAAVVLVTTDRKEIRIPQAEVEEMELSRVSVMPDGLSDQLTRQEFADLVKFLLYAR